MRPALPPRRLASLLALLFVAVPVHAQLAATPVTLASSNEEANGRFGMAVANAGDVDGDGKDDVIVGAPFEDPGASPTDAGRAYVFSGATGTVLYTLVSPNEEASGLFGGAVAGAGDVDGDGKDDLVVGAQGEDPGVAPSDAGRAYVFSGATGTVLYTLTSPNEEADAFFGSSVAGAGDVDGDGKDDVVVGAAQEDPGASPLDAGRAYVFSGATGALLYTLVSPNEQSSGNFGYSVAGAGDVDGDGKDDVIVGAANEPPSGSPPGAGRAYVFSGATGTVLYTLTSPNEETGGSFGVSVAGAGDVDGDGRADLVVGANQEDPGTSPADAGRAYVFSGATGTVLYTLQSPNEEAAGVFGQFVRGAGDVNGDGRDDVIVSAHAEDPGTSPLDAGRAYVFSGATGTVLYTLVSPNEEASGLFGLSVAGAGDTNGDGRADLVVGAVFEDPGASPSNAGRAYIFETSFTAGLVLGGIASPNEEASGEFGIAVANAGDVDGDGKDDVIVGAPFEDPGASPLDAGRAYVFSGATGALLYTLVSPNEETSGLFGGAVAGAGDVDDDGHADLVVGARSEDPGASPSSAGRAYVFSGASGTVLYTLQSPNEEASGLFGLSVAGAGDVDGDGKDDVIVGAQFEDPGASPTDAGRAYVFSGASGTVLYTLQSPNEEGSGRLGYSVAGAGDVNGDGKDDVIVGAFEEDPGASPTDAGRAYVFSGASGTVLYTLQSPNEEITGNFGVAVAGAGDMNGDGKDDVIVGAHAEDPGVAPSDAGRAYVFSGATGALLYTLQSPNEQAFASFGYSVAGAGDMDGDGKDDVLVGAYREETGASPTNAGRAYVFSGATGALLYTLQSPNEETGGAFGLFVGGGGDTNGDGRTDVLVGAYQEDPGASPTNAGRAYSFSGASGVAPNASTPGVATVATGAGWRLVAPPLSGLTVGTLAGLNLVQGVSDEFPTGLPNLFTGYSGNAAAANAGFSVPAAKSTTLTPGRGVLWYFFASGGPANDDVRGTSRRAALPVVLTASGNATTSDVTVTVTSAERTGATNGFYLLGNPFALSFDLSGLSIDAASDAVSSLVNVMQLYDGTSWSTRTRVSGNTDGNAADDVPVWQGFFAEVTTDGVQDGPAYNPTVGTPLTFTFSYAAIAGTSPAFVGKQGVADPLALLSFELSGDVDGVPVVDRAATLLLHPDATAGFDVYDATKLDPLTAVSATLALVGERSGAPYRQAQRSLPLALGGPVEVPLDLRVPAAARLTLAWSGVETLPTTLQVFLLDRTRGTQTLLSDAATYPFEATPADSARFALRLVPGAATGTETLGAGRGLRLLPPTPNPFETRAAIRFVTDEAGPVRVSLFDVLGRRVALLFDGAATPGAVQRVPLEGHGLAEGVYVVRAEQNGHAQSRQVVRAR